MPELPSANNDCTAGHDLILDGIRVRKEAEEDGEIAIFVDNVVWKSSFAWYIANEPEIRETAGPLGSLKSVTVVGEVVLVGDSILLLLILAKGVNKSN